MSNSRETTQGSPAPPTAVPAAQAVSSGQATSGSTAGNSAGTGGTLTSVWWLFFAPLVSGFICWLIAPTSNQGFKDTAAVLSFVTMAAVAIERLLELFWTLVGQTQGLGGWWPMKTVIDNAKAIEDGANDLLGPRLQAVRSHLDSLTKSASTAADIVKAAKAQLDSLESAESALAQRLDALKTLAPGSARVALATNVASDAHRILSRAASLGSTSSTNVSKAVDNASTAVTIAADIIASFQDNPARRIASIILGTSAGLLVSGVVGLNLFEAILKQDAGLLGASAGVMVTGLIIGLGSSPTHEIVKALQNYKKARQPQIGTQVPEPDVSEHGVFSLLQQARLGEALELGSAKQMSVDFGRTRSGRAVAFRSTE